MYTSFYITPYSLYQVWTSQISESSDILVCEEQNPAHLLGFADLFPSLSSDLVSFGAGRAGEETETAEQAGAGHWHNGPEQLRTIRRLHLLLLFFTPPLHRSLSLAPLTRKTNKTPNPNNTDTLQTDWSSTLQTGGVRQRWAGLCTLTCVCVCLSAAPYGVRDWDTGHFHTCIRGKMCQLTAFDFCGCWCLWFAWFLISGL